MTKMMICTIRNGVLPRNLVTYRAKVIRGYLPQQLQIKYKKLKIQEPIMQVYQRANHQYALVEMIVMEENERDYHWNLSSGELTILGEWSEYANEEVI